MPFSCAKAVCATFCHHIAPALVPIFGPDFPSICVLPEAPKHGRMIIDQSIVVAATAEAEVFRRQQPLTARSSEEAQYGATTTVFDKFDQSPPLIPIRKLRAKKHDYSTTSPDIDNSDYSSSDGRSSHTNSPATPSSYTSTSNSYNWCPINDPHNHNTAAHNRNSQIELSKQATNMFASPYPYGINNHHNNNDHLAQLHHPVVSAIPRSTSVADITSIPLPLPTPSASPDRCPTSFRTLKRPLQEYDEESSTHNSFNPLRRPAISTEDRGVDIFTSSHPSTSPVHQEGNEAMDNVSDKNAAWLLLNLSMQG